MLFRMQCKRLLPHQPGEARYPWRGPRAREAGARIQDWLDRSRGLGGHPHGVFAGRTDRDRALQGASCAREAVLREPLGAADELPCEL